MVDVNHFLLHRKTHFPEVLGFLNGIRIIYIVIRQTKLVTTILDICGTNLLTSVRMDRIVINTNNEDKP